MSLHPDPVEQLLERHGERWRTAFSPPSLDGMLAVAAASPRHRTRWVWPLVAAVVLLVIPLATVLAVHGSHRSPAPGATRPSGNLDTAHWSGAVLQADGRTVTVSVDTGFCVGEAPPTTRSVVSETATTVTITAQVVRPSYPTPSVPPGSPVGCAGVGYAAPLTIRLSQPLGNRTLIDATTGIHRPVLRASTLLKPSYVPTGYVEHGIIHWNDEVQQSQVLQDYTGPAGELRVVRGYAFPAEPDQQVLGTGTVLGHPAKLIQNSRQPGRLCVLWDDSTYSWSICSQDFYARRAPLDAAELLRIGNSMR